MTLFFERADGTIAGSTTGDESVVIGRADDADIRIVEPSVSRVHARLAKVGGKFRLTDLDSSGGVVVNGAHVSQIELSDGDVVRFGDAEVRVRIDAPAPVAVEAAPELPASTGTADAPHVPIRRIVSIVLLLASAFFAYRVLSDGSAEEAARRYREAAQAEAAGDLSAAVKAYEDAARLGGRAVATEARAHLSRLGEIVRRREAAEVELSAVVLSVGGVSLDELETKLRVVARRYLDVLPRELIDARVAELRKEAGAKSAARLQRAVEAVDGRLAARQFGGAASEAAAAAKDVLLTRDDFVKAAALPRKVAAAASAAIVSIREETAALGLAERVSRLKIEAPHFEGSPSQESFRALLEAAERAAAAAGVVASAPADVGETPATSAPPTDAKREIEAAEAAWKARDYVAAAAAWGRAGVDDVRARRAASLAPFRSRLVARFESERPKLRELRFGGDLSASLTNVDDERLEFDVGSGAKLRFSWARFDADRLAAMIERLSWSVEDERSLAEWWLAWNEPRRALDVLAKVARDGPESVARVAPLVAEAREMAVPADGFVLREGAFLTREEFAEAELRSALKKGSDAVATAAPGAWKAPLEALTALGPRGEEAAKAALETRIAAHRAAVAAWPTLKGSALESTRARLFAMLEERRVAAFALIFDEKAYPYPYAANQSEVQAEVDRLVDLVRDVWERPSKILLAVDPAKKSDPEWARLAAMVDDASKTAEAAAAYGVVVEPTFASREIDRVVAMSSYAPDGKTRSLLDDSKEIEAYNATQTAVISEFEREVHRITNAYRLMMGRRSVMIDDKLVLAARGHSEEMASIGYFAHDSPTPGRKSPSDRARLAGWGGGVSENIARGAPTPAGAVAGWIGSSGHHRNILGAGHTHLGVGHAPNGNFWTQNFGRGALKPPK